MSDEEPVDEGGEREITTEEFAAAMVQRLGRIPVRDVLLQTMATLADIAGIRMGLGPEGDEVRDLAQARHAIEGLRALLQVTEAELGAAQVRPFRDPLAQLQLVYARLSEAPDQPAPAAAEPAAAGEAEGEPPPATGDAPDGGSASRLWVPPHYRGGQKG